MAPIQRHIEYPFAENKICVCFFFCFPLLVFRENISLLEIVLFFPGGLLSKWKIAFQDPKVSVRFHVSGQAGKYERELEHDIVCTPVGQVPCEPFGACTSLSAKLVRDRIERLAGASA